MIPLDVTEFEPNPILSYVVFYVMKKSLEDSALPPVTSCAIVEVDSPPTAIEEIVFHVMLEPDLPKDTRRTGCGPLSLGTNLHLSYFFR